MPLTFSQHPFAIHLVFLPSRLLEGLIPDVLHVRDPATGIMAEY
jgi:hypothetical protein